MVGERGQSLSAASGRVSIARAILHNADTDLDEATSRFDTENEKQIQRHWIDWLGRTGRSRFGHRLSTLQSANRLVVLEEGQKREEGTARRAAEKRDGKTPSCTRRQMKWHGERSRGRAVGSRGGMVA